MTRDGFGFLLISPPPLLSVISDWLLWGHAEAPSAVRADRNCHFGCATSVAPSAKAPQQNLCPVKGANPSAVIINHDFRPNILHSKY
jgi:hypothetical protein